MRLPTRHLQMERLEDRFVLAGVSVLAEVNPDNDHTYHLIKAADGQSGISWTEAEATAVELGGHLVTINDAAENEWLTATFADPYLWIGLNDAATEGEFVWTSEEPVSYTNWYGGEPNNFEGGEDYVHIYNFDSALRQWNDNKDVNTIGEFAVFGVAEVEVEPPPNEAPTDILLSNAAINENSPGGTLVGEFTVIDDEEFHEIFLTSGADGPFEVIGNQLRVRDGAILDFESQPEFEITVVAADSLNQTVERDFTITLLDVNEVPTDIELSNAFVDENAPGGTVVGEVLVTDPDGGDAHEVFLVVGVESPFEIVENLLVVRDGAILDFETTSVYEIVIAAIDFGGLGIERSFTIFVRDVDEEPLLFNSVPRFNVVIESVHSPSSKSAECTGGLDPEPCPCPCPTDQQVDPNDSGDPVYLHSGEYFHEAIDLEIPGRGFNWRFARKYRSGTTFDGPLGHNWDFNYNRRLAEVTSANLSEIRQTYADAQLGDVVRMDGNTRADLYVRNVDGSYSAPAGFYTQLARFPDGSFAERDFEGFEIDYAAADASGLARMTRWADRNGNALSFEYNASGQLSRVIDTLGRPIEYFYEGDGRLIEVRDFINRSIRFAYDVNGDLVSVTSPIVVNTPTGNDFPVGKSVNYTYSTGFADERLNHNLLTVTAPNEVATGGPPRVVITYQTDTASVDVDRVLSQFDGGTNGSDVPAGGTISYSYTSLPNSPGPNDFVTPVSQTTVTDRNGNITEYEINQIGNAVRVSEFTNRDVRPGDPQFFETSFDYNRDGQMVRAIYPEGNVLEVTFDDGSADRLRQGDVLMTRLVADSDRGGDQNHITTASSFEPIYSLVQTSVDPRGLDPNFMPQNGGLASTERYTTRSFFDYQEPTELAANAPDARLDLDGSGRVNQSPLIAIDPAVLTTEVWLVQELGLPETSSGLDDLRARLRLNPGDSNPVELGLGDLNDDGIEGVLDESGIPVPTIKGNVIRIEHPTVNLLSGSSQAAVEGDTLQEIVETFRYNRFGQLTSLTDPEGNVTENNYFSEQDPNGDSIVDNPAGATDTGGYLRQFIGDTTSDPTRNSGTNPAPTNIHTTYERDTVGNVTRISDGRGIAIDITVNELNQPVKITRAAAIDPALADPDEPMNLVTFGYLEHFFYDHNDNIVRNQIEDRGNTSDVGVWGDIDGDDDVDADDIDALYALVGSSASLETDLQLDRMIDESDVDFLVRRILGAASGDYNLDGRVSAADYTIWRDNEGSTMVGLVADGNRDGIVNDPDYAIWKQNFGQTNAISQPHSFVDYSYEYDILDQLIQTSDEVSRSENLITRFRYDANGNPVLTIFPEGNATSAIFDERDLVFRTTRGELTAPSDALMAPTDPVEFDVRGGAPCDCTSVRYDGNGNIIETVDSDDTDLSVANNSNIGPGDRTRYQYDGFDRLVSEVDSVGNQTVHQYDPSSNLLRISHFGPVGGFSPVADGPGILAAPVSSDGVIQSANLVNANLLAATEFQYDELSRGYQTDQVLFVNTIPTVRPPDVQDGADGPELGKGNLTSGDSQDILGISGVTIIGRVSTRSEFDRNSRQTFLVEDDEDRFRMLYDGANRIIRSIDPEDNTVEYAYDDNHNVIEIRETDVSQVVGVADEIFLTTYFYDSLDRLQRSVDNVGQATFYRYDSRDNLVAMADAQGPLTGATISRRAFPDGVLTVNAINDIGNVTRYSYDGINRQTLQEIVLTQLPESVAGTSTGGNSATTLNDTNQSFGDPATLNQILVITGGAGAGQQRRIVDSTGTQLVVSPAWDTIPDATSAYLVTSGTASGDGQHIGASIFGVKDDPSVPASFTPAADPTQGGGDGIIRIGQTFDANSLLSALIDDQGNISLYLYDNLNRPVTETKGLTTTSPLTRDFILGARKVPTPTAATINSPATISDALLENQILEAKVRIDAVANLFPPLADDVATPPPPPKPTTIVTVYSPESNVLITETENDAELFTRYDAINRPVAVRVFRSQGSPATRAPDSHLGDPIFAPAPVADPSNFSGDAFPAEIGTTKQDYHYDGLSRVTRATDNNDPATAGDDSVATWAFDSLSRVIEETQQIGVHSAKTISSSFRAENLRSGLTYPNGRTIESTYDGLDRLNTITDVGAVLPIVDYDYIGDRVLVRSYPQNGTQLTHLDDSGTVDIGYDGLRRTVQRRDVRSDDSLIVGFTHIYDRANNKLTEAKLHSAANSEVYSYDSAYRLIKFERPDPAAIAPLHSVFTLDGAGNWQQVDGETREHSSFNEITSRSTSSGTTALTYDDNGNLTDDGDQLYFWDSLNRLRLVVRKSDGLSVAVYTYDAVGRRIRKDVTNSGDLDGITDYYYDGWQVLEERDGSDAVTQQYVYGRYIDEPLVLDRNIDGGPSPTDASDQRLFYHQNTLSSVFAITTANAGVAEGYQYDAYGRQMIFTSGTNGQVDFGADDESASGSLVANPYMFTGRRLDEDTGLVYFRNRYYSAAQGRFLSRDSTGYVDGPNLYEYVSGFAVNSVDPMGFQLQRLGWGKFSGGGKEAKSKTEIWYRVRVVCVPHETFKKCFRHEITVDYASRIRIETGKNSKNARNPKDGFTFPEGVYGHEQRHENSVNDKLNSALSPGGTIHARIAALEAKRYSKRSCYDNINDVRKDIEKLVTKAIADAAGHDAQGKPGSGTRYPPTEGRGRMPDPMSAENWKKMTKSLVKQGYKKFGGSGEKW